MDSVKRPNFVFNMKGKSILLILNLSTVLIGCHSNSNDSSTPELMEPEVIQVVDAYSALEVTLTSQAQIQSASWMSFSTWRQHVRLLKEDDDLFFNSEMPAIANFFTELENAIPESIASTGLTGRLKVVKTNALAFRETLSLFGKEDVQTASARYSLLISHNNLLQFINQTVEKNALPDFNGPTKLN